MDGLSDELSSRLDRLSRSRFRTRFILHENDIKYFQEKGLDNIMGHANRFIRDRLAPANPPKDGSQTPMKGHPVFIAQHATATCCRSCLKRWHGMEKGVRLTESQITWILELIKTWFLTQLEREQVCDEDQSVRKRGDHQGMLF